MDTGVLIDLLMDAGLPTALALYLIWRNKIISEERITDLKSMTEIVSKNTVFMEKLTEAVERGLGKR